MRSRISGGDQNRDASALIDNKSKVDIRWGKSPLKHSKKSNIIIKNKQMYTSATPFKRTTDASRFDIKSRNSPDLKEVGLGSNSI